MPKAAKISFLEEKTTGSDREDNRVIPTHLTKEHWLSFTM